MRRYPPAVIYVPPTSPSQIHPGLARRLWNRVALALASMPVLG